MLIAKVSDSYLSQTCAQPTNILRPAPTSMEPDRRSSHRKQHDQPLV